MYQLGNRFALLYESLIKYSSFKITPAFYRMHDQTQMLELHVYCYILC